MSKTNLILSLALVAALAACGDDDSAASRSAEGDAAHGHTHGGANHHGAIVGLGQVALGGESFAIARHGACEPGKESAFVVSRVGPGSRAGLFLWLEDDAGEQICAPAQGDRSGDDWHFHVTPRSDAAAAARVVLRLREGDLDERAALSVLPGAAPRHDGIAAPIIGDDGSVAGFLELKLHDDKGDLELWLAEDAAMTGPLDLPLDAVIGVTFLDHGDRKVELRVRNREANEDEDGQGNIRSGRSNYFIFPGESGADASWLRGASFRSAVSVVIPSPSGSLASAIFMLVPHGHGDDDHEH